MMAMAKLTRMPKNDEGLSRYRHPAGFSIRQARRDWDARSYKGGLADAAGPRQWWEVRPWATRTVRPPMLFDTLRDARAWCDSQVTA